MSPTQLNWSQRIGLESLWFAARLFSMLPYWFKYYIFQNLLFVVLYYCIRYRMKVVKQNLRNSFPEKSERELTVICRRFYHTLAELFVDTVNMAHKDWDKARRMMKIRDLDAHRETVEGKDWIAMTAHFGCWEYCSYWGIYEPEQVTVAVYHPLHSPIMECFYRRLRDNFHSIPVPMKESLLFYLRHREKGVEGKRIVMGLIADQNPPKRLDNHWFRFLNQDTLFFDGAEKLALRCKLPIYFVWTKRLAPGRYELAFEQIYDGVEQVAPYQITERYVRRLERMICEYPELWLWSHRRWKHKRTDVNR